MKPDDLLATVRDLAEASRALADLACRLLDRAGQPATAAAAPYPVAPVAPSGGEAGRLADWASGPRPKHLPDFSVVYWPGVGQFRLSAGQARMVARLWAAQARGEPCVHEDALMEAANVESTVVQLFRSSPAWRRLVLRGPAPRTYTLPDLPANTGE